jgi:hypothetical protein
LLNNHDEFQLLNDKGYRLRIKEFVEEYEKNCSLIRYLFKPEISNYHNNLFGDMKLLHENIDKSCKKLSNLDKFDNKDILSPIKSEEIENRRNN